MKNEHTIPAVEKTITLLEKMSQESGGSTHTELARACGITSSTCYRILRSLMKYGWVSKETNGTFTLGSGLLPLSLKAVESNGENWENVQTILETLSTETGLSSKISIRRGEFEQFVLARAESPGPFSVTGKVNVSYSVVEGSVGAALLADSTPEERIALLRATVDDIPEKNDSTLLENAVAFVRKHGYFLNIEHNRWRIGALSVPVRNRSGKIVAAFTLLGMADEFTQDILPRLLAALEQAQKQFSRY